MTTRMLSMPRVLVLFSFLTMVTAGTPDVWAQEKADRIIYTGRLMGYFRYPETPQESPKECPALTDIQYDANLEQPATNAGRFLKELNALRADGTALVGTGDSFAPEYDGRIMLFNGKRVLKDSVVWDAAGKKWVTNSEAANDPALTHVLESGNGTVPADNVACFLKAAGYDALVPGKYDFFFGPERLRQLARLLATEQPYGRVDMLGANLVIKTRDTQANPPVPEWLLSRLLETVPEELEPGIEDGSSVTPWLRWVRLGGVSGQKVSICEVTLPAAQFQRALGSSDRPGCVALIPSTRENNPAYDLPLTFVLQPGARYALVVDQPTSKTYVNYFDTYRPFFVFPNHINPPGTQLPTAHAGGEISPAPYVIKSSNDTDPRREIAIFGIVDIGLKESVGSLNYSWSNTEDDYATEMDTIDPAAALREVLQYFEEDYKARHNETAFAGRKILLANMRHERAAELVALFPGVFTAVVTEAELEHATPEYDTTLTVVPTTPETGRIPSDVTIADASTLQWIAPTEPLVPAPFYDDSVLDANFKLKLELQAADMEKIASCPAGSPGACREKWRFHTERITHKLDNPTQFLLAADNVFSAAVTSAAKTEGIPIPEQITDESLEDIFRKLTLASIRHYRTTPSRLSPKKQNVDIAILQRRDWFKAYVRTIPDSSDRYSLQEALDRLIWKGDFVKRLAITGAKLKDAMDASEAFADLDDDQLALSHERKRDLIVLGIYKDPASEIFYVNDEPLDDGKLYSVVTSDFISLGDTGYPSLKEEFHEEIGPRDFKNLRYISSVVCETLRKVAAYRDQMCSESISGDDYFDRIALAPTVQDSGLTGLRDFWNWISFRVPPKPFGKDPTLEQRVQRRGRWNITIEKIGAGYSFDRHNKGSETDLQNSLSGVQESGLADPRTFTWNLSFAGESSRKILGKLSFFTRQELDFQRKLTRQDNQITIENPSNKLAYEAGARVAFRMSRVFSTFSLTASFREDTQAKAPYSTFSLADESTLIINNNRTSPTRSGKAGVRLESSGKLLEFGYQLGRSFGVPRGYRFPDLNAECPAPMTLDAESISDCITRLSEANEGSPAQPLLGSSSRYEIDFTTRPKEGLYWNSKFTVPLIHDSLTYTLENKGNLYFHKPGDTPLETYYLTIVSHSLKIPILNQLSLKPQLDMIFFENKVERSSLTRLQSSVSLEYTFDWRSGLSLKKAAAYGLLKNKE